MINGVSQVIPSAGVTLANTGLTAATLYYIYAYMDGATMTLEASATGHAQHTDGVEIKSGDATRSLVGMVYTGAGTPGTFQTVPYILSWYNRMARYAHATYATDRSSTVVPFTEMSASERAYFLVWESTPIELGFVGSVTCTQGSGVTVRMCVGIDGVACGSGLAFTGTGYNSLASFNYVGISTGPSEGLHYALGMGGIYAGSSTPNVVIKGGSLTYAKVWG